MDRHMRWRFFLFILFGQALLSLDGLQDRYL